MDTGCSNARTTEPMNEDVCAGNAEKEAPGRNWRTGPDCSVVVHELVMAWV